MPELPEGYVIVAGPCFACGEVFTFNPIHATSVVVEGSREPLCAKCVAEVNRIRTCQHLDPIVVHPQAYEPCPEEELNANKQNERIVK